LVGTRKTQGGGAARGPRYNRLPEGFGLKNQWEGGNKGFGTIRKTKQVGGRETGTWEQVRKTEKLPGADQVKGTRPKKTKPRLEKTTSKRRVVWTRKEGNIIEGGANQTGTWSGGDGKKQKKKGEAEARRGVVSKSLQWRTGAQESVVKVGERGANPSQKEEIVKVTQERGLD